MGRFLIGIVIGMVAMAHLSLADAKPAQSTNAQPTSTAKPAGGLSALPPAPSGKSTVIGGAIRQVDPVRDQFTLQVFGGGKMKILFDERTHVYRDGVKVPLRDLRPDGHASVETVLDGTAIFALSVHTLSRSPEGQSQGQVLRYDAGKGELTVSNALSHQAIELRVPPGTPIVHVGQAASSSVGSVASELTKGTLISVKFLSNTKGPGIASQISILAAPGSAFEFAGNITFLDLHAKRLVLVDPRDGKSYSISFDPARFPISQHLHPGMHVRVTADFNGSGYVANAIKAD